MEKMISIIMSTYNETEDELDYCINSILNQTYKNLEFLIVDDNPQNEELANYLRRIDDERVKILYNEKNIGLVNSLNRALSVCNGYYVARMDADDISYKNRFQEQVLFLEQGNYDLIGSNIEQIHEDNTHIKNRCISSNPIILTHKLKRKNVLPHPTWLGKKQLFDDLNGYRNVPYCEDYDFLLRAINQHRKIGCVPTVLLKYRIRSKGITQSRYCEQYVLSKSLSRAASNNKMTIESIEIYIKSSEYAKNVLDYKKFKHAKDNLKKGCISYINVKETFTSKYFMELLKDKL